MDVYLRIAQAQSAGDGGDGTTAGAGGEGVAGASFPDFNADIGTVEDLHELDVGPVGKARVGFNQGAEFADKVFGYFAAQDHAVWVSDGRGAESYFLGSDSHFFVNDLSRWAGYGYIGTVEADRAHIDGDISAVLADFDFDLAAEGVNVELVARRFAGVIKVSCEDAEAVAAFFCFAAVGIEYAEGKIGLGCRGGAVEDTVGAYAVIAVTYSVDLVFGRRFAEFIRVEDDVIVSQCVVFVEFHYF